MININGINKIINQKYILKDINLSLKENELICILGPSGSGKTTLLNIIGKILKPTTGEIIYKNQNINNIKEEDYYNEVVSFIFQEYNLLKCLSIKDNILLANKIEKRMHTRYKKIINMLNLHIKNKTINDLSGGEQQRIAIARCLISNTKIILADEPTGALDSKNSYKIMKILKKISKEKLVLVVTHNEKLAYHFADRIIKLKDGMIIYDSRPHTYNDNYKEEIINKTKIQNKKIFRICINNLLNKKKRNILTSIAFSIGLLSLTIVLSINNGFKKEITNYEKKLYEYPLIISKEAYSLNKNIFSNQEYNQNTININKNNGLITNNIDKKLLNKINKIDNKLYNDITYYKDIDLYFKTISHVLPSNISFDVLIGKMPQKKSEILLLLDYNQSLDENIYNFLNINSKNFEDYIGAKLKINNKLLTITGIVKSTNEYFATLNGILYQEELFEGTVTDIHIYPKDYQSKIKIKEELKDINIIDNAENTLSLTKEIIDVISIILIIFCFISLIVSCIMIYIITYISIIERKREIGILRTLGLRKKEIKKIFINENLILGLISSSISITLTYGISKILNNIILSFTGLNQIILLNAKIIISIFFITIFLSYISSAIPAKQAAKKTIYESLKSIY